MALRVGPHRVIVFLVNAYGEQLRVQLGSPRMAEVVEHAINTGWSIMRIWKPER
jgi:hypothetical protein